MDEEKWEEYITLSNRVRNKEVIFYLRDSTKVKGIYIGSIFGYNFGGVKKKALLLEIDHGMVNHIPYDQVMYWKCVEERKDTPFGEAIKGIDFIKWKKGFPNKKEFMILTPVGVFPGRINTYTGNVLQFKDNKWSIVEGEYFWTNTPNFEYVKELLK